VSLCDFAELEQRANCLAVERAAAAQAAAESAARAAAERSGWLETATAIVGMAVSLAPWVVAGLAIYWLGPVIRGWFTGENNVTIEAGQLKLQVERIRKLEAEATATAVDLSLDLMDVSTVVEYAMNWPDWPRFKPDFTRDGYVSLRQVDGRAAAFRAQEVLGQGDRAVRRRALRILWVDDTERLADYKIRVLERRGHSVRHELTTDTAATVIERDRFDLVVSDSVREGDRDAWRLLLHKLRSEDTAKSRQPTPFVVQTDPVKAQALMTTEKGSGSALTEDESAFATFSFMLIRDRVAFLERGGKPREEPDALKGE
jgi:CheY-like chemotaxis protein